MERSSDVKKFLEALHPTGCYEIRALDCPHQKGGKFSAVASAYFMASDLKVAASIARQLDNREPTGVCVSVNAVNPDCRGRSYREIALPARKTTKDADIKTVRRLFLDFDPKKGEETQSATDAESEEARKLAEQAKADLRALEWPEPIYGGSGNGFYLVFSVEPMAPGTGTAVISNAVDSLGAKYKSAGAELDTSTKNVGRLMKILGTVARKGSNTPETVDDSDGTVAPARPHRRSWHEIPDDWDQTKVTREQLEAVAAEYLAASKPAKTEDK
ncbi:MAG TPA: hypothetical protein DDW52_23295, partial [Planctomycetaceae bacterium]|nr:hypothetical protein [Planctomycetaceae bacterium]